jgi:hypothetical protein
MVRLNDAPKGVAGAITMATPVVKEGSSERTAVMTYPVHLFPYAVKM